MKKENHLNIHPIDFTKIYTFIRKRNLSLMDYMNKHFHVTMPLTHCTLTAQTVGIPSILYKIANPVNDLAGIDNIPWNNLNSHLFVPWIL